MHNVTRTTTRARAASQAFRAALNVTLSGSCIFWRTVLVVGIVLCDHETLVGRRYSADDSPGELPAGIVLFLQGGQMKWPFRRLRWSRNFELKNSKLSLHGRRWNGQFMCPLHVPTLKKEDDTRWQFIRAITGGIPSTNQGFVITQDATNDQPRSPKDTATTRGDIQGGPKGPDCLTFRLNGVHGRISKRPVGVGRGETSCSLVSQHGIRRRTR